MTAPADALATFVYLGRSVSRGKLAHGYRAEAGPDALTSDGGSYLFAKALSPRPLIGHRYTVRVRPTASGGWTVVGGAERDEGLEPIDGEERARLVVKDRAALAEHEAAKAEKRIRAGEIEDLGDLTLGALRAQMRRALPHQRAALLAVALDYLRTA